MGATTAKAHRRRVGFLLPIPKGASAGELRRPAAGACMWKLVMICYGVLRNRAPFDPAWTSSITR